MSTTVPRFIIVNDADPSIQYTGPWFSSQGSRNPLGLGDDGPPYQNTLHGTNMSASLSFAFNGTQIKVLGTFDPTQNQNATWQCFIDDVNAQTIPASQIPTTAVNNLVLCEQDTLVDGPHILTVNATVLPSLNQTFWFNDIQYVPSASVPLDQAAIMVSSLDPQLHYGPGWLGLEGYGNMTPVTGSILTYSFIGVSVSWYGWIGSGTPYQFGVRPSPASYSIDGQTPTNFIVGAFPRTQSIVTNQKFFETPLLSAGPHTLKVVYEGNNSSPLTLDFLVVQNGTISSSTTMSASSHATTGNSAFGTSTPEKSFIPVGAIVGGVIGGIAIIVFALLGFLLLLRRRRRRSAQEWSTKEWSMQEWSTQEQDSIPMPTPFDYTPLHPSNNPPSPQITQMGSAVTHRAKGQVVMLGIDAEYSTGISQPIEPSSTSSGVTANLHSVPLRRTTLTLANPSELLSSPGVSEPSSVPSSPASPSKAVREAEALASHRPRSRGNPSSDPSDTWLSNVILHADSGVRIPSNTASTSVVDVPPVYTPD